MYYQSSGPVLFLLLSIPLTVGYLSRPRCHKATHTARGGHECRVWGRDRHPRKIEFDQRVWAEALFTYLYAIIPVIPTRAVSHPILRIARTTDLVLERATWASGSELHRPRPLEPRAFCEPCNTHILPRVLAILVPLTRTKANTVSSMSGGHLQRQLTRHGGKSTPSRWQHPASALDPAAPRRSAWISRTWAQRKSAS